MSEMLEKSFSEFLATVTPEMIAEKKKLFDEYLNKQYTGKPWRRLTNEEVILLSDKDLLNQIEALTKISGDDKVVVRESDGAIMESSDSREITGGQDFVVGHGGDIGGPDGRAYETEEDWARLDADIATERSRIYRLVTSPPRTAKYVEIFKKKFPNRSEKEIMNGFVLSEDGVDAPDFAAWKERQDASHKRAGANRLEHVEVARREEIAPENKEALAYADNNATMAIHREVLGNSVGNVTKHLQDTMNKGYRESQIAQRKFDVADNEGFVPEEDLIDPERYKLNGDAVDMPVDEMTQQQRDSLKITEIVRHVPPKGAANV